MTVRSPLRVLARTVAIIVVAACTPPAPSTPSTAAPGPSATEAAAVPSPTPMPTAAVATVPPFQATQRPSGVPDEDSLPTSASVERDGVRLTLRLGLNPLYAGNQVAAFATIENTGDTTLRWLNSGCDVNARITGVVDSTWRDSTLDVSADLAPYREWLREAAYVEEPISLLFDTGFRSSRFSGCADLGLPRQLAPGRKVTQEAIWDGSAAWSLGLPPTAAATITAHFERWWRGSEAESPGNSLEVSLDSWVLNGRPDEFLSPAEAIDAALKDERLTSWLVTRRLHYGADAIAQYDRDLGLWAVGLLMYHDDGDPILHAAFLDPVTGEVIAIREHRVTL